MSEEPNLVGTMLGSYRITGELSRGGMGAVYRAEHAVLERHVAVKLLRPDLTSNDELVSRFINEAKAASAIQHPGIIEVLDFGHASDGRAYFVMEMLEGESLAQRIASRGRLHERDAAQVARGVASALTAAHGKGIIHRDLKPDNVFLVADPDLGERPKVLDFGIAKLGDGVKYTQTGALIGTPLYMAPEQARAASHIDHRADLYSLGCMFYEMLVGTPPFTAVGAGEIIAMQLFATPERPSTRVPGVSPEIERIVMRLLEKEPTDRFQDAAELAAALDVVLDGERTAEPGTRRMAPPRLMPTESVTARDNTPRRSLGLIAALSVGGLLAIGVAAVMVRGGGDEDERGPRPSTQQPAHAGAPGPQPPPTRDPAQQPTSDPAPQAPPPAAVPDPVLDSTPPAATAPARPRREKPRSQKGSAAKYTKDGSPIEIDLD